MGPGTDYLEITPTSTATKLKINKWHRIKLKSFYTAEKTHQQNEKTYRMGKKLQIIYTIKTVSKR